MGWKFGWKTEFGWKTAGCGWEGVLALSGPELRGTSSTSRGRPAGRILTGEGVARLSEPKKEKAGTRAGARVSGTLTVWTVTGLAVVVTGGGGGGAVVVVVGGGAGAVVVSGARLVVVLGAAGWVVLVSTLFGRNLFWRRKAGKLLNPSLLSSFSWPTSLLSSLWLFSFGRRNCLLGPFLLNSFRRGLMVVVLVVVVVVVLMVVVAVKVMVVGTNGDVAGAVTSSGGNEEVSFYSCGHI